MFENINTVSPLNYTIELSVRIEKLDQLWEKLCFVNWSSEAFQSMRQLVVGLVGQSKEYGFNGVSDTGVKFVSYLDRIIESRQVPEETQRYHISQLIYALKNTIDDTAKHSVANIKEEAENYNYQEINKRNGKLIYIVDDDASLIEFISVQISAIGYPVRLFSSPEEMLFTLGMNKPAAIIMDVVFPDSSFSGIDAAKQIVEQTNHKIPVMLMSGRTDMSARIQAIRAGSSAYFTKPIEVFDVINKLDELLLHENDSPYKVLVVNDDESLAEYCSNVLQLEGINSLIVKQPLKIIQYIRSFDPDLVLIDVDLNDCKGTELAAVIRQESDLKQLPVVYLSSDLNSGVLQSTLSQEGDEFLIKPVNDKDLVCVVRRNIERAKRLTGGFKDNQKLDIDVGLTKLKNFLADVEVAVLSSVESNKKKSVFWIRFDGLEKIYREVGAAYSNSIIRQISYAMRSCVTEKDHITKFSDTVFAILTVSREQNKTREIADSIFEKMSSLVVKVTNRSFSLKCNIGISHILPNSQSGKKLLAEAENACFHAGDSNTNNVIHYRSSIEQSSDGNVYSFPRKGIEKGLREKSFSLVFQPILSIGEKKEELYEVLVRMLGENGDLLLPADFLPVALEKGLMHEIDRWVIDHATTKLSDDFHARSHANLFMKLSSESLNDKMLITWVSNCLKNSRIRGQQRLFFELSEHVIVKNMSSIKEFAKSMKDLGCGLVLDHFGDTAHSMEILNELSVDFVKIQSASINEISINNDLRIKYESLIRSALEKCDDVIVGAVENPHNLSLIWDWGVRYVQGYFIQPPHEDLLFDFENTVTFK